MNPSLRAVLAVVLVLALTVITASWIPDLSEGYRWPFRLGGLAVAALALGLLIHAEFKKDEVPEFLYRNFGKFHETDGLCFVVGNAVKGGHSVLRVHFQNRYSKRCEAIIRIRPIRQWFRMPEVPVCRIRIRCPGAAYGSAEIGWPIPLSWQGKTILLGLAAAVRYPDGKGDLLRFREGSAVDTIRSDFWDTFFSLSALATAHTLPQNQGRISVKLPRDVDETVPKNQAAETVKIIWPLDANAAV